MYQTRSCTPSGCAAESNCVNDYYTQDWQNQGCGQGGCESWQQYQTRNSAYHCLPESRCLDDSGCYWCDDWVNDFCGVWTCTERQMHQTRNCYPDAWAAEDQCLNDYSLDEWSDQGCGQNSCIESQMYQTSPTFYGCYVAEQCVDDTCDDWVDQSCGGNDCLPSQMHRTRDCVYACLAETDCDLREFDSPTPSVDLTCGSGETVFDFSWNSPGASVCPVDPVEYFWRVGEGDWSSPLLDLAVLAGPYSHGDHTFEVKVKDASERGSLPGSVGFSVDSLAPSEPDPSYEPVCGVATGDEVTFSWEAVIDEGCANGTIGYAWNIDAGVEGPWSEWQSETTAVWTAETGEHIFYVKARDGVGNESEVGSVTIGVDCFDGPTVEIVVDACTRPNKRRPYWSWTAVPNCADSLREIHPFQIFLDNDPTEEVNLVDQGYWTQSYFQPSFDLEDGYYALVVRAFDSCDQFSDQEAPEDAYVDGTAPVFSDFLCFQSPEEGEDMDECLDGVCSQKNYVRFEWEAVDEGDYPSGLRSKNTYYWYANFNRVGLPGRNGWLNDNYWGPYTIFDNEAPWPNQFNVVAYDACGNNGNPLPGTIPSLLVDTNPPNSVISVPENGFCFREEEGFANFTGTVKDGACAGVTDLDIWMQREADDFCWDGSEWIDSCPLLLDTDVNDLDPPAAAGTNVGWSRANDLPLPGDGSADGRYQVCAVGEDSFGQAEGVNDVCNAFIYDNTLPVCGDKMTLSDAESGGWVTTRTEYVLVETSGFWDENCTMATYSARIFREGVKIWPVGQGWYYQTDTICTTTGGYPNNHYVFEGVPPREAVDGDQLEICFDVVDCAGNQATDNPIEDCPVMEVAPRLCKTVTIFDPAWFQTGDGNVHTNAAASNSIFSSIPTRATDPYFSLGSAGNVSAGGGMDFGVGEVSLKGWKVDGYSGSLYRVEQKDYDFFWELFGSPEEAPELKGNTSDPCNSGVDIAGAKVCYNPGNLTIEYKPQPFNFSGVKIIFVNGDLQVNRKIVVNDPDEESVVVFFVKGDVNISWDLESADSDDPIFEGVYVVDGAIYSARIAANAGKECLYDEETGESDPETCEYDHNNNPEYSENEWPGKRLVAKGIFITYGGFRLSSPYGRNLKLCSGGRLICNRNTPAELFVYSPDLFENLPDLLKEQSLSWFEVAP